MSDEELRRLEREVERTKTPESRLALARAFERAGKKDDALRALVPAAHDETVRREIARFPVWGRDAARTSWIDAEPVVREPRVKWRWSYQERGWPDRPTLFASPLGVVVPSRFAPGGGWPLAGIVVVDPGTGAERFGWNGLAHDIVRDRVLRSGPDGVFARDIFTGDDQPLLQASADTEHGVVVRGSTAVVRDERGLVVLELEDPPLVKFRVDLGQAPPPPHLVADLTDKAVLVDRWDLGRDGGTETIAFDLETGDELLRAKSIYTLDDAGALIASSDERDPWNALVQVDPDGTRRVLIGDRIPCLILQETTLVHEHPGGVGRLQVIERATGKRGPLLKAVGSGRVLACARDVLFSYEKRVEERAPFTLHDEIVATRFPDAQELWRLTIPRDEGFPRERGFGAPRAIACGSGTVYVLGEDGSVIAVE